MSVNRLMRQFTYQRWANRFCNK